MAYKRTEHRKAVLKLVREKGMVLQKDAAEIMNKYSIASTAEKLEQEGKIKRQKVRVRMKNGNLNDMWLLYIPGTDPNAILDYEKELINRPFSSPLKEHHCYKRNKDVPVEVIESDITQTVNNSNVVQMQDYVRINEQDVMIKEFEGQRVVTFNDIDLIHNRVKGTSSRNFRENKEYFIQGKHFFSLTPDKFKSDEIRRFGINSPKGGYLITERGYMLLVKSLTDKLSWTVQEQLVDTYFEMKELKQDQSLVNVQQIQNVQMIDFMEMMVKEFKNQNNRITNLEGKLSNIVNVLAR
jgi:hypothetical protein